MPDINYFAVLVSGVVAMIVGGVWYGPLFGKMWMEGMGWDPNNQALMAEKKKDMVASYAQMFVLALVQALVLAHVLWAYGIAFPEIIGAWAGIQGGFWVWLGFVLPLRYGDKLWDGKKFRFVAVDLAYYLVLLCIIGIILSIWK